MLAILSLIEKKRDKLVSSQVPIRMGKRGSPAGFYDAGSLDTGEENAQSGNSIIAEPKYLFNLYKDHVGVCGGELTWT